MKLIAKLADEHFDATKQVNQRCANCGAVGLRTRSAEFFCFCKTLLASDWQSGSRVIPFQINQNFTILPPNIFNFSETFSMR